MPINNKKLDVLFLKTARKTSYLSGKAAHKVSRGFNKIDNILTANIQKRTGSKSTGKISHIDSFFHESFPYLDPIHPALPNIDQKPSVTVFVPSLTPRGFYGGIATLLIVSGKLAEKLGYNYRIVQTSGFEKNTKVLEFLAENGIVIDKEKYETINVSNRGPDKFAYLPIHPEDIVVVSAWWDAFNANRLPLKNKFVYMIQDYEPIFYNNSDEQVFAEQTYHTENFIPLCNTKLLYNFFANDSYKYIKDSAICFEPAVGKEPISHPEIKRKVKKLFLYGRPVVHRNLFYNAIRAIDKAMEDERMSKFTWKIYSAGQSNIPDIRLKSGHIITNLGKMNLKEYYKFASTIDVAVSPMLAPHPNYPTLELASLGAAVVSTKYETKYDLNFYSKNIIMSEPDSYSMAQAIIEAGTTPRYILNKNTKNNNICHDWSKSLDEPLDKVVSKLSKPKIR